jgi:competence protein ComEA
MQRISPTISYLAIVALGAALLASGIPAAADRATAQAATATDTPVDLNSATAAQLETVPGIGKALAGRIVAFREKHGPFRRLEDLMKVKGIGEKSLEKLRPYIRVGTDR